MTVPEDILYCASDEVVGGEAHAHTRRQRRFGEGHGTRVFHYGGCAAGCRMARGFLPTVIRPWQERRKELMLSLHPFQLATLRVSCGSDGGSTDW